MSRHVKMVLFALFVSTICVIADQEHSSPDERDASGLFDSIQDYMRWEFPSRSSKHHAEKRRESNRPFGWKSGKHGLKSWWQKQWKGAKQQWKRAKKGARAFKRRARKAARAFKRRAKKAAREATRLGREKLRKIRQKYLHAAGVARNRCHAFWKGCPSPPQGESSDEPQGELSQAELDKLAAETVAENPARVRGERSEWRQAFSRDGDMSRQALQGLSVKELSQLLLDRGIPCKHCVEKEHLVDAIAAHSEEHDSTHESEEDSEEDGDNSEDDADDDDDSKHDEENEMDTAGDAPGQNKDEAATSKDEHSDSSGMDDNDEETDRIVEAHREIRAKQHELQQKRTDLLRQQLQESSQDPSEGADRKRLQEELRAGLAKQATLADARFKRTTEDLHEAVQESTVLSLSVSSLASEVARLKAELAEVVAKGADTEDATESGVYQATAYLWCLLLWALGIVASVVFLSIIRLLGGHLQRTRAASESDRVSPNLPAQQPAEGSGEQQGDSQQAASVEPGEVEEGEAAEEQVEKEQPGGESCVQEAVPVEWRHAVESLEQMGFASSQVRDAVRASAGRVPEALDALTAGSAALDKSAGSSALDKSAGSSALDKPQDSHETPHETPRDTAAEQAAHAAMASDLEEFAGNQGQWTEVDSAGEQLQLAAGDTAEVQARQRSVAEQEGAVPEASAECRPPEGEGMDPVVEELVGMGFCRVKAAEALASVDGCMKKAIRILVEQERASAKN